MVAWLKGGVEQEQARRERAAKLLNESAPLKQTETLAEQQLQETTELTQEFHQAALLQEQLSVAVGCGVTTPRATSASICLRPHDWGGAQA